MDDNKSNKLVRQVKSPDNILTRIEKLADTVSQSELSLPFRELDDDNKYKLDVDGKFIVNKGAIMSAMILGDELGISPIASLMLGKTLNEKSFHSILRGRALGIDPITSIAKIYNITAGGKSILSFDVSIISSAIIKSGTTMEYIRDSQTLPTYYAADGTYIGHKYQAFNEDDTLKSDFFLISCDVKDLVKGSEEHIAAKDAKKEGKIIIYQKGITKVTSLRLVRKLDNGEVSDNTFHYSLQQATDANGLYRGYHSTYIEDGKRVYYEGRDNWNNHPETMLRNRVTSIAGRIMVSDKLEGTYSHEEAMEIVNVQTTEELQDYEDITPKT